MAPVTQSYDPTVVGWITRAAKATGADPAALLATSIQESGARRGAVGDAGTSFGPFQFHRGGALGTHTPAWANSYPAVLNRAQEFRRLNVHGGVGAAAVQRPADRSLYAQGVERNLQQARAILAKMGAAPAEPANSPFKTPVLPPASRTLPDDSENRDADVGHTMLQSLIDANAHVAKLPGSASLSDESASESPLQRMLEANAALAGIAAPTLPDAMTAPASAATPIPAARTPNPSRNGSEVQPSSQGKVRKVVPFKPKIIGTPYHGTHTVGNWESDNAVDIAMPEGTPIRAPADGVIGSQIGSLGSNNPRFAGLRVHLVMPGNELYLAHLSRLNVKAGQKVKAGQIIGWSGIANGIAHLHMGAKNGNPARYA